MQETAQHFEKQFFSKQVLDFHGPYRIICYTSKLWNFVKITGPWWAVETKKIYRVKEDQAFWLSLELGRREKVVRHSSADFLPSPHMFMTDNDAPSVLGGGQDFVDTMYYCSENKKGMRDHWFYEYSILKN